MTTQTPLLDGLFVDNPAIYARIVAEDKTGICTHAERLLLRAATADVRGLAKLGRDAGGAMKLQNLLCELECALLFAELGARCELLEDGLWKPNYAPDLHVRFNDGLELLIDVTRGGDTSPDVHSALHEMIEAKNIPYHVDYSLGHTLSVPGIDYATRRNAEEARSAFLAAGVAALVDAHANSRRTGAVHVFQDGAASTRTETVDRDAQHFPTEDDIETPSGEEWLGCLAFEPPIASKGTAGGSVTYLHLINDDKHEGRFLYALEEKAKKRGKLPVARQSAPFLVAYYNDESELMPRAVLSAVTGARTGYGGPQAVRDEMRAKNRATFPLEIDAALVSPWRPLFTEWGYDDVSVGFTDFGALTKSWYADLSGVLVVHHDNNHQFLPNPLAASNINEIRLLSFGLSIAKYGRIRKSA